jgi:hypothetical protein
MLLIALLKDIFIPGLRQGFEHDSDRHLDTELPVKFLASFSGFLGLRLMESTHKMWFMRFGEK